MSESIRRLGEAISDHTNSAYQLGRREGAREALDLYRALLREGVDVESVGEDIIDEIIDGQFA